MEAQAGQGRAGQGGGGWTGDNAMGTGSRGMQYVLQLWTQGKGRGEEGKGREAGHSYLILQLTRCVCLFLQYAVHFVRGPGPGARGAEAGGPAAIM